MRFEPRGALVGLVLAYASDKPDAPEGQIDQQRIDGKGAQTLSLRKGAHPWIVAVLLKDGAPAPMVWALNPAAPARGGTGILPVTPPPQAGSLCHKRQTLSDANTIDVDGRPIRVAMDNAGQGVRVGVLAQAIAAGRADEPGPITLTDTLVAGAFPFVVERRTIDHGAPGRPQHCTLDYYLNSIGMALAGVWRDSATQHILVGATEVTQGQYRQVMGKNPSANQGGNDYPVERVSFRDAQEFCKKLSSMEGRTYRLPTEEIWERACRAGSTMAFAFGDGEDLLKRYGWYDANSEGEAHAVKGKAPNAYGLYDMHGNVWEWTVGTRVRSVLRGGSYAGRAGDCRSTSRLPFDNPDSRGPDMGFRVMCVRARE